MAIEAGQAIVPEDAKEQFRRLLNSGKYVELLQQTPRTGQIAQNLRWKHELVLAGVDALHFAAAIEASVDELMSLSPRGQRRRNAVLAKEICSMAKSRTAKSQSERFIEAARAIGCDEDPAHFDEILKKVARHKPPPNAPPEPKKPKTKKPGQ